MKRKFELGRPPALTKLGEKRIRDVRTRGGNLKKRALRLDAGNFSWGSEAVAKKVRLLNVVYNASNNELVRTNTLVKNCVVQIDATPFRQWYKQHYGTDVGRKQKAASGKEAEKKKAEEAGKKDPKAATADKKSKSVIKKLFLRRKASGKIDPALEEQFQTGRLLAVVSSRPGQCGRADGYILEGPELEFYNKKIYRRKK